MIRRRKNTIMRIQNDSGDWIENQSDLENMETTFYRSLFTEHGDYEPFCLSNSLPEISQEDKNMLAAPLSHQEIWNAFSRMGNWKAPKPDGFHALFYKSLWSTVGPSLCRLIQNIQENPGKVAEINKTFITLITKVENMVSLKQMRPISLCNVFYKLHHERVMHAVSWETLCLPKSEGGLNMREARLINKSFMMNNCWSLCVQQVIRAKYSCGEEAIPVVIKRNVPSNLWRGICDAWDAVTPFIAWNIGDGKKTKFWKDRWLPSRIIFRDVALAHILVEVSDRKVHDYVSADGDWKVEEFHKLIPWSVII
uniref:LINE-1 reverse transcriptase isogeny n=1 Tax=Cajanus cajan TaxID=3821 RepID=A0A151QTX7_CAJCA|nr:LINE-1 reverse transcriptase isogeny [Cajanus cajan]